MRKLNFYGKERKIITTSIFIALLALLFFLAVWVYLSNNRIYIAVFSIAVFVTGVVFLHLNYYGNMQQNEQKIRDAADENMQNQIRVLRHRYRNQLQILSGYLEMGLVDDALDYLSRSDLSSIDQKMELGVPEIELILFDKLRLARGFELTFDLQLNWIHINKSQLPHLCSILEELLDLAVQQMYYVKSRKLMHGDLVQSMIVGSGLRMHANGNQLENRWYIELVLTGIPIAASRSLVNKLNVLKAKSLNYGVHICHQLQTATATFELSGPCENTAY